jgi:uncharacterized protein (DUF58 family)
VTAGTTVEKTGVRITPAGRAVLVGSVVLLVAGRFLGYPELWAPAATGLAALVAAALVAAVRWRAPVPVAVERRPVPRRVVRGEKATARLTVSVVSGRRGAPTLSLRDRLDGRPVEVRVGRLKAGGTRLHEYPLPTGRRGLLELGPLRLIRSDPFGLVEVAKGLGGRETLWVYPKAVPLAPQSSGNRRDLDGPDSDGAAGSITFHSLREYVTGDDLRMVHWRSTARTGRLMVRQHVDPSQPQTTVVLDTDPGSYATRSGGAPDLDLFEMAVEAAASVIVGSVARNFPARLLTGGGIAVGGRVSGATGAATVMLDHLTPVQPDGDPLGGTASRLSAEPGGNSLVVVTSSPDPPELMAVESVRARYASMVVVRFRTGIEPGVSSDRGVVDLVAPDLGTFASLWNGRS